MRKIIRSGAGSRIPSLQELFDYREVCLALLARDLRVRYKQTVLGAAWAIIQPVAMMLIFTAVFGKMLNVPSDGYPYAVFVYSGLLPWTFFAAAVTASSRSLVVSVNLITRIYFPRILIPAAAIGVPLVDFMIALSVLFALMLSFGIVPTPQILALPALVMLMLITALGIGSIVAALAIRYRDFVQIVPFGLQFLFYLTPVLYPVTIVPEPYRNLIFLNPLAGIVDGFRSAILGASINLEPLMVSLLASILLTVIGMYFFHRAEEHFADVA